MTEGELWAVYTSLESLENSVPATQTALKAALVAATAAAKTALVTLLNPPT